MREREIEQILMGGVRRRGGLCLKFVSPARAGVPDRIVIARGRVIFVEIKSESGRLTRIQEMQLERLRMHGVEARVLYGMDEALKFVAEVLPD
jgi:Holliday junction resolvase